MSGLLRRYRLWRWDCEFGGVLALAERRFTVMLGHGHRSERLWRIITDLRAARDKLCI